MTLHNKISIDFSTIKTRAFLGGCIGLLLTTLFIFSADAPNPEWNTYWYIQPLAIVTLSTALAGTCTCLLETQFKKMDWNKVVAYVLSIIGFIVALWLSFVVGFNGTYWN